MKTNREQAHQENVEMIRNLHRTLKAYGMTPHDDVRKFLQNKMKFMKICQEANHSQFQTELERRMQYVLDLYQDTETVGTAFSNLPR